MSDATHAGVYEALPRRFNAAVRFVDQHVESGRCGRVAIVHDGGGRELTYQELYAGINRLGNALRRLGVRRESRVLVLLPDSPEFAFAFWSAIKIGAIPVPLHTALPERDYELVFADSRAETVIASEPLAKVVEDVGHRTGAVQRVLVSGERPGQISLRDAMAAESSHLEVADTTKDDVAFWLYTSGTTGVPKAAMHLQHDMVICCDAFGRHVLEIAEHDRCLSVAKLFFAYGLGNSLYYPMYVGASTVLDAARFDPARMLELVRDTKPSLFFAVPTAYAAMLRQLDAGLQADFGSVRRCLSAGEPLPRSLYERWRDKTGLEILDGIGSTEMCNTFIANRSGQARAGSSGTLVPGYEARIVDEAGAELATGRVGQLEVKGESAFAGYWNQHRLTKRTIAGEWVRTGDQYRRDEDGYFWFEGRTDDMIKVSGAWVSPAEVESALLEHAAVAEAGVVGARDADGLIKPVAFVVLGAGRSSTPDLASELEEFVRRRLAPHKYPRRILFVTDLPKTPTGKLRRFQLREMAADQTELRTD